MSEIPNSIQDQTKARFATILMQKAMRLINLKKVSISFSKGSMDSYLILSGLVKDDRNHECKIVYKKREEDTEKGPLTSNCDCSSWKSDKHCEHTAALFIFHLMSQHIQAEGESLFPSGPLGFASDHAVTVDMFGTIVWGPQYLNGGSSAHSYSTLQYLLLNRKVVNFPLPQKMTGKIRLDLITKDRDTKEPYRIPQLFFSYLDEENKRVKEISIFENHYLFNWKSGEAYHLDKEAKDFISKVKYSSAMQDTDEIVNYFLNTGLNEELDLYLDGKQWEDIEEVEIFSRLAISPGEKKGYLTSTLSFFDSNEVIRRPPKLIKSLNFSSGILASFRRKKDGYAFIKDLSTDLKEGTDLSKQHLNQMLAKDKIVQYVRNVRENKNQYIYDVDREQKYKIDLNFIQKYIINFVTCFSETSFRFSEYYDDRMEIEYLIPTNTLLSGVSIFYQALEPYGMTIYYNQVEVHKWRSRIKFERRSHTTKWFDLELQISDEDLEIIRNAEIQNGIVLSSKGLVLLNQEQKDLIRFMKKYTQYEGNPEEETEESSEPTEPLAPGLKKFVLPFQRARIFELFELKKMGIDGALTDEEIQLCENLANLQELPEYTVPDKLKGIMRPYQLTGYHWLNFLYEYKLGACLADDMGLGKTLQAISFIEKNIDEMDKILVVCPVSILLNWEKEFQKFSNIDLSIYHGGAREFDDSKKVILTSYGVMKKEHSTTFANIHFNCLILDEVQHLKNIRSLGAFAARSIKADFRICLTGTPVENDLSEFYNILDLSVPGIWGNLEFVRTVSNKKSRLLARKTARPFILRRTKDQVLSELPPKTENNVYLSFEDKEDNSYKELLKTVKNRIYLSPTKKRYGEILKGILELRKSCLWQDTPESDPVLRQNISSTKIHFLIETLEQIREEGHKAIVFSQFTTYLDLIQRALHEQHYSLARIDGSQSIKKRQEQVDLFQEGDANVFLISLKAGGVGLNLTAASYVFIMDPWWNPAVEAQAIDRAHRIGQKNTLTVYRPIIKNSVEEKVLELQAMKRELFKDLMADDDESVYSGKLTMTDFEQLLE